MSKKKKPSWWNSDLKRNIFSNLSLYWNMVALTNMQSEHLVRLSLLQTYVLVQNIFPNVTENQV